MLILAKNNDIKKRSKPSLLFSHYIKSDSFVTPMDCSASGYSLHGISQARILEWAAISLSRKSSQPRDQTRIYDLAGKFFIIEPPGKPINIYKSFTNNCQDSEATNMPLISE